MSGASGSPQKINDQDLSAKGLNPRVSATFRVNEHLLLHALGAKGFRFGGIQLVPTTTSSNLTEPLNDTFKSDRLWSYEAGARTDWFQHRVTVDATAFHQKWKDLQITVTDSTGLFNYVTNIGAAHSEGIEASLQVLLFDGLRLSSAAAWIRAQTDEPFPTSSGNVPEGTRLPGTPRLQFADVLSYAGQRRWLAPSIELIHSHVGRSYNNLFGSQEMGGYDTFDARVRLQLAAVALHPEVALALNNITDRRGIAGAYADPSVSTKDIYFITPRALTLTTTLRY